MDIEIIEQMKHRRIDNYAGIPGLTSWMLYKADKGCVRLFEMFRDQEEYITPHSHRFDFSCLVLKGEVENTLYVPESIWEEDEYTISTMKYNGEVGEYTKTVDAHGVPLMKKVLTYFTNSTYSMKADEIHSIKFSKGAKVLFFEGATVKNSSIILEPYVYGEHIPTFKVEEWMFRTRPSI